MAKIVSRFVALSIWTKIGVIGSIASIIGFALPLIQSGITHRDGELLQSGTANTQIQNNGGTLNFNQPATQIDPRGLAGSMNAAAGALRLIAQDRIPLGNPPPTYISAENHFRIARELFLAGKFIESAQEYKRAGYLYQELLVMYER